MQQLTPIDSQFLALETAECPMTMGLLIMLEGPYSANSIDHLMTVLKAGALRVERHHERVWYSPFKHDIPYWLNDGSLQVGRHVSHHQLPPPGNTRQLHTLVEELLMRRLDRSQPLWEFHLISGLENGKHALVFKLHHACADGLSALKMFAQTVAAPNDATVHWPASESATTGQRNWLAFRNLLRHPARFAYNLLAQPLLWLFLACLPKRHLDQRPPQASRFIGQIGRRRSYATLQFSIADFRRINRRFASSENEVLMTLYSGALRRYLLAHDELPERSLHAGMPISMMFSTQRKQASNQAGLIRVTLGTRIADPVQRLKVMKERCARALEREPPKLWKRMEFLWLNASPQLIGLAVRVYRTLLQRGRLSPTASAVTTYMPGPARSVAVGDFKIEGIYPLSLIYHGCGLSISAMRYGKHINCGIVADQTMLPDPETFIAHMQAEFDLLYKQACAETD